ncbi:MAG: ATP-binding protein [Treponema sp.]|jgi:AAA15 family ATPase/GTPase|nr:ATP-binding protein [Treponema sp.]
MILEFSIENTYSIKERQTISFEAVDDNGDDDDRHIINIGGKKLLKLAAIYGANASGKSNIIKAFNFYIQFILDSFTALKPYEKILFEPFLFVENPERSSGFFEIVFYFEQIWYKYQIRLNREKVLNESLSVIEKDNETIIFSFNAIDNTHICKMEDEKLLQFVRHNATFLSAAAQFNHMFLGKIYRHLKNVIISLEEPAFFDYTRNMLHNEQKRIGDITRLFNKAGIDHLGDIIIQKKVMLRSVDATDENNEILRSIDTEDKTKETLRMIDMADVSVTKEIMFAHEYDKKYILSFFSESMGTRRFFELAGPLMDCIHHEKNMFIDEIESSLHDDLLDFFIRTFLENTKESQLLFTTHNQNLLDSPLLRNDEVWFAQKDNSGGSEFFSLAEFKDIPVNVSRRELYKAGAFGASPRTSRFFKN